MSVTMLIGKKKDVNVLRKLCDIELMMHRISNVFKGLL